MPTIYDEPEQTEPKKYKGESTASDADIKEVGGEKTLSIQNILFQSDADAQAMADSLLARLKDRKEYFEASSEFCPVPIERRDTVLAQERITSTYWSRYPYGDATRKYGDNSILYRSNGIVLAHLGILRSLQLSVTPNNQTLTFTLEV